MTSTSTSTSTPLPPPAHAAPGEPSPWVRRFAPLLEPGARVLDLACGSGRHARWLAACGFAVTAVDRDRAALAMLAGRDGIEAITADLEDGSPWPLDGRRFDAVVVTNYLWRPLLPRLEESLADGGLLLYETFADGQQSVGRPSRPEFLLARGELLRAFQRLRVVAFEDGWLGGEPPAGDGTPRRCVQRIAALKAVPGGAGAAAKIDLSPTPGLP